MRQTSHSKAAARLLAVLAAVAGLALCPAQAQEAEWARLYTGAAALYTKGDYLQALVMAKQALAVAEKTFGAEDRIVGDTLHGVAMLYRAQRQYKEAEPLFRRSLAIREKVLGPDDPELAQSLNMLAELYDSNGQAAQAEAAYKRALAIREKALGADHLDVAESLNNLAVLYRSPNQYAQAEPLYKRSLAIREKALGTGHRVVAESLSNLGIMYKAQGRYADAEPVFKRALAIRENALGPDHPDVAASLNSLAGVYYFQRHYEQAEPLLKRALAIREKALGPDHSDVASSLNDLAALYKTRGEFTAAETLYTRSLAIWEKALGADHLWVASSLIRVGQLYVEQGQFGRAEPFYVRALAIREKARGADHPDVATGLINLGELFREQGKYAQAEPLYVRALAIREKAFGAEHESVAEALNDLAILHHTRGQYGEAGALFRRALAIHEKILGPDHPDVATNLNNLAQVYYSQGQYVETEPLLYRALAIREKVLGLNHPDVASSLNGLAVMYNTQKKYAQAEPLLQRAVAIWEKAYGPDHPDVAHGLNSLASLYLARREYAKAEPLTLRALAIREKVLGPLHPELAMTLTDLAALYRAQGLYQKAEPIYLRALQIREKSLGMEHLRVAQSLNSLAEMYRRQKQDAQALPYARRASAIYRTRIIDGGTGEAAVREASMNKAGFLRHLSLLAVNPEQEPEARIADEAFQIVQLEQASGTASAIAKMAARFASGDDALAGLVKRKQDSNERQAKNESQLVSAASKPPKERSATAERVLRDDIARMTQEIAAIDADLTRRFPEYQELTRPEPLAVARIQPLLRAGEAMLVYAFDDEQQAYIWLLRQDSVRFVQHPVDVKAVAAKVATVRSEMDFDDSGNATRVSVAALHELYQQLFAPALPYLAGVTHLMVVPSGSLQSLPFSMLVASPPPEIKVDADYRKVDWLARHYAFSVLPSVSSIQAFRQFAKTPGLQEPFAGFGDPLIGGGAAAGTVARGKRGRVDIAGVFRNLMASAGAGAPTIAPASEIADVDAIRGAPRLAETADELRAMAQALKSDAKSIWLQGNATETRIKQLDLSKYRTLAFATHGVMAGEIKGIGEPGLILTPPQHGSLEDDGYLSSGEIAKLKLNADWVVLSACNTAAADGTPGAEGLSGLAKAFFYAGARSLLVSHWPVASEATVPLTTAMLKEYESNPAQGKAEAHRKAMLALIETPKHPEYAHPLFWAPFVVVGEGGAGTPRPAKLPEQIRQ